MTEQKKKKEGAYASLTGFKRAVPIILVALAVFIGLCFITKNTNTGALGKGISNVVLGLFSIGGYFIPLFLLIHAFFFASDIQRKRLVSRIIFSLVAIISISSMTHAITYFGADYTFSASKAYAAGVVGDGGGFIGALVSFCLMKIFGSVGVIIIALLIFALYITYFFSAGKSAIARFLLKVLNVISDFFTNAGERKKERKERSEAKKEAQRREELAEQQEILMDDEFFDADNGYKELKISGLGIIETKNEKDLEMRPALQEKVIHDGEIHIKAENAGASSDNERKEETKKRFINPDYSTTDSLHGLNDSVADSEFEPRSNDIIYEEPIDEPKPSRTGENADDVFGASFEPFDFKLNQELAAKKSSKAAEAPKKDEGITELSSPINDITEDDIEKARMLADFEMKKKAALEAHRRYAEAKAAEERERTEATAAAVELESSTAGTGIDYTEASADPEKERTERESFKPYIPEYMQENSSEPEEEMRTEAIEEKPVLNWEPRPETTHTEKQYSYSDAYTNAEPTGAEKAESATAVPQPETPAYMYNQYRPTASTPSAYRRAAEYANAIRQHNDEAPAENTFKPYAPPKAEEVAPIDDRTKYCAESDNSIRITRTVITPEPEEKYSESEEERSDITVQSTIPESLTDEISERSGVDFEFENGEKTITSYGDAPSAEEDDGDDEELFESVEFDSYKTPDEDESDPYGEEIPEGEQNEDVKRLRALFPSLDEESESDEIKANEYYSAPESNDEEETPDGEELLDDEPEDEEDEPPFESYTPIRRAPEKAPEPEKPAPVKADYSDYQFPPLDLLIPGQTFIDPQQEEEKNINAEKLVDSLLQFGVRVSIKGIDRGPRITRYEIVPARGVKVNSVTNLFNDIALSLGAEGIRMEAPIPGKSAIGVEIPNKKPSTVYLRDLVESDEFTRSESKTLSCLGKDVTGNPVFADIAKMPHILIAGATGMGKSVCINAILVSILYKSKPDEVKFIMIDPKKVEFNGYNGIPHLLVPVVTDVKQAAGALMWAVEQMEKRYELMESIEVRKLDAYNEKVRENPALGEPLPKIIIVIDELNDIMLQVRKPAEDLIMSIAQKARAAGIHLIIGTQRPSVDVITGVIKANIPSRISCKVTSFNDSKTILEQAGAEKLLNNGDMLYVPAGAPKALRVQGAFVSDGEVSSVMKFLKSQAKGDIYDAQALEDINRAAQKCTKGGKGGDDFNDDDDDDEDVGILNDQQFLDAVDIAIRSNKISTSLLQRKIKIGYGKAAKFIDYMEEMGIVSEPNGQKPRDVLITKDEWHEMLARRSLD